jgi:hypothetical protein
MIVSIFGIPTTCASIAHKSNIETLIKFRHVKDCQKVGNLIVVQVIKIHRPLNASEEELYTKKKFIRSKSNCMAEHGKKELFFRHQVDHRN